MEDLEDFEDLIAKNFDYFTKYGVMKAIVHIDYDSLDLILHRMIFSKFH